MPAFLCHFSVNCLTLLAAKGQELPLNRHLYLQKKLHLWIQFGYDPAKRQIHIENHGFKKLMTQNDKITAEKTLDGLGPNSTGMGAQEKKVINFSDAPEQSSAWFQLAKRASQLPEKKQVSLRIDEDILEFFKKQGSRYQTRMHAVLRAYVDGSKS